MDQKSASQAYAWVFRDPDVVFIDPVSRATISIGSARNAAVVGAEEYDYVINCCPGDLTVRHPRVRALNLADTDDVSLDVVRDELATILSEVRAILSTVGDAGTQGGRILCHCWMGASRSVAVAIYLLCMIHGPRAAAATPQVEFDTWYAAFKSCRPCINVSIRLRHEVCRLLQDARSRMLGGGDRGGSGSGSGGSASGGSASGGIASGGSASGGSASGGSASGGSASGGSASGGIASGGSASGGSASGGSASGGSTCEGETVTDR